MAGSPKHTLYANSAQTRFYWIPDDADLPPGAYALRSLTGVRIEVDEAGVGPYKITEDRAKELTVEVFSRVTEGAGKFLSGLGAMMQDVAKKRRAPEGEGEPPKDDPDAVLEGLEQLWQSLEATANEVIDKGMAAGKEADAATRERVRKAMDAAGANMDAAEASMGELRGRMRDFLANPELKRRLDEARKRLEELADELGGLTSSKSTPSGDNRPTEE